MQFESCMIEKRRYTGGFYIEHHSYVKSGSEKSVHVVAKDTSGCFQTIDSKKINFNKPKELSLAQSTPVLSCNASIKHLQAQPCNFNHTSSNLKTPSAKELLSNSGHLKHKKSSVHPDAMKSFASGLAAIGILITIIILGLNSLWIVAALVLATLFFGIAAGKLANRAFKDMQYARDRFSGKGLAAAGMVLGVLSIAALVGLFLITILGITFSLFT